MFYKERYKKSTYFESTNYNYAFRTCRSAGRLALGQFFSEKNIRKLYFKNVQSE